MKRITIKDMAKMLHLSTSTVSRALSDHPDISEATKIRVRTVANEFNYRTNLHASLFRKSRSGLIALVLPELNMFFTPQLIAGINQVIATTKNSLIVFLSNNSYEREKEIVQQCLGWAVEGVLISLSKETSDIDHLDAFIKSEVACVLLDKTLGDGDFSTVTIDNEAASYKAMTHLIKEGHQNILGIFGNPNYRISQDRIKGYRKALSENNISILEENIISVDKSSDLDFILPPVINHNEKISAVFTMSDELLAKSHALLLSLGKKIPDDIAVVSISDGVYPYLTFPKITHVKNSGNEMGVIACKLLLDSIEGTTKKYDNHVVIPTQLVSLSSV